MSALLIIDLDIVDLEGFLVYTEKIPALIAKYSGRYVVKGVPPEVVQDSGHQPARSVVLEFPSRQMAKEFLAERQQSELYDLWMKTTRARILLVDGVS